MFIDWMKEWQGWVALQNVRIDWCHTVTNIPDQGIRFDVEGLPYTG